MHTSKDGASMRDWTSVICTSTGWEPFKIDVNRGGREGGGPKKSIPYFFQIANSKLFFILEPNLQRIRFITRNKEPQSDPQFDESSPDAGTDPAPKSLHVFFCTKFKEFAFFWKFREEGTQAPCHRLNESKGGCKIYWPTPLAFGWEG